MKVYIIHYQYKMEDHKPKVHCETSHREAVKFRKQLWEQAEQNERRLVANLCICTIKPTQAAFIRLLEHFANCETVIVEPEEIELI